MIYPYSILFLNTIPKKIAAFFMESRRLTAYVGMIDLLGIRSKIVVCF
jgi:hypothetical protein